MFYLGLKCYCSNKQFSKPQLLKQHIQVWENLQQSSYIVLRPSTIILYTVFFFKKIIVIIYGTSFLKYEFTMVATACTLSVKA